MQFLILHKLSKKGQYWSIFSLCWIKLLVFFTVWYSIVKRDSITLDFTDTPGI